ncbi:MAG TPA: N-acetylmuramoyl-L-alanine amidase [Anaerovoracaceae bacterium]|nr:N-acetylmuramoyl-L-alanine amidase [Anaerovoracaceae bacterium]
MYYQMAQITPTANPSVFLSPSVQYFNLYITEGDERYWMNQIADAMIPYLQASGIRFGRNNPDGTLSQAIAASNAGGYDFHLALHSNASPPSNPGAFQGPDVYYYATSEDGRRMANIIADNFKVIYPNPDLVITVPNTSLAELRQTTAPAVLVEVAYHDNWQDANWIMDNVDLIARTLVLSLTEYFGIPFVEPVF